MCSFYAHAQQKMVLLNGNEIPLKSYTVNNEDIVYKKLDAKNDRTKSVEKIDVFSIVKEDGTEELFYKSDTLTFTVEEVRNYIRGEQTAKQYYNKPANKWIAGAFGLGSCVLSFYSLPVPMLYGVVVGRFNPRKMQIPADVKVEGSTTDP